MDEMQLDPNSQVGDLALIYSPFKNASEQDNNITSIYLPRTINIKKSQIQSLPDGTILGKIVNKLDTTQEVLRAVTEGMNIVFKFTSTDIYPNDIVYSLDEDEIYTRQDDEKGYVELALSNIRDITYTNPTTSYYSFRWNTDGYWESTNTHSGNYCYGRIAFTLDKEQDVKLDLKFRDAAYRSSCTIVGLLDTPLSQSDTIDSSNYKYETQYRTSDTSSQQTLIYENVPARYSLY